MGKLGFAALHTTYNGKVGFRCASHNLQWYTGEVGFRCASPNLQWESWVSLRFTPTYIPALHTNLQWEVGFRCASHNLQWYTGEVGFRCASPNLQWESWVSLRFTQPTMGKLGFAALHPTYNGTLGKLGFAALHTNLH
ncbi:hypothetical protein APPUASWS_016845, partial [Arthrospira platensis str. Paraca]